MSLDEMAAKAFRVSSFTSVGHLLHINLKDHLLQYKHQIGEALLKNNSRALAVVNKVNSIDNTYRNFEIEVIAKREGCEKSDAELMIVELNENKCRFQLDFSKVYWNSRLSTEHERITAKLNKPCDIVFDLFAGVGPYSVPAAKAKCRTYANDLNPESVKWLEINMRRNKVNRDLYEISNLDAKDFILDNLKALLLREYKRCEDEELATKPKIHIIMNLPAVATTFLPYFIGLLRNDNKQDLINSKELFDVFKDQSIEHVIYCYCFLKGMYDDPKAEVRSIVEGHLGRELYDDQLIEISRVRNVAPYKDMYRVDIRLDENILFDRKNVVSIMKSTTRRSSTTSINGISKRVTIQAPGAKRTLEETLDTSSESSFDEANGTKRSRVGEYCSII